MAQKRVWLGSAGPFLFDDASFPGLRSEAVIICEAAPTAANEVARKAEVDAADAALKGYPYVTVGNVGDLTAERAITAGTGITLTDGGANSTITLAVDTAWSDGRYFQQSEFIITSSGIGDAGKPIKLDADGMIDSTMLDIVGDGNPGRVLRCLKGEISDGTNAGTIKVRLSWVVGYSWNSLASETDDNIGKGDTVGNVSLDASGSTLSMKVEDTVKTAITVCETGQGGFNTTPDSDSIDLVFYDYNGNAQDLTTYVDSHTVEFRTFYITTS